MLNFESFLKKGQLYIETEIDESELEWKYIINLSDIWKEYETNKNLTNFNNKYYNKIIENKNNLSEKIGDFSVDEIIPIAKELKSDLNQEESEKTYNKLYDIFDKYEIKIEV